MNNTYTYQTEYSDIKHSMCELFKLHVHVEKM